MANPFMVFNHNHLSITCLGVSSFLLQLHILSILFKDFSGLFDPGLAQVPKSRPRNSSFAERIGSDQLWPPFHERLSDRLKLLL
jgi:hypothetical protein